MSLPNMYSASMLKKRWPSPPCRKLYVTSCQGMKSCPGHSANQPTSDAPPDVSRRNTRTLAITSAWVTGGTDAFRERASGPLLDVLQDLVGGARHVLLQPEQNRF